MTKLLSHEQSWSDKAWSDWMDTEQIPYELGTAQAINRAITEGETAFNRFIFHKLYEVTCK